MQVQAEIRPPKRDCLYRWRQDRLYVRIPFKHWREPVLDDHRNLKIGAASLQQFQSRRRQDTVAERTQPYYSDPRFEREMLKRIFHADFWLLFDLCFVDQHHGNFVPDRVDPLALRAF
jgi:hypothetical protein